MSLKVFLFFFCILFPGFALFAQDNNENSGTSSDSIEKKTSLDQKKNVKVVKDKSSLRPYKWPGIWIAAGGAAIVFSGFGFDAAALSKYRKYENMMDLESLEKARMENTDADEYISSAEKHRDTGNTYKSLRTASWITGGILVASGIILAVIPGKNEKRTNVYMLFDENSFYGGISFEL